MSTNNRNIQNEGDFEKDKNVSGRPQGTNTGPVAGGADNTRGENKSGENKSNKEGSNKGEKGQYSRNGNSPQGSIANPTTTSRGADSTDKEFRNNQANDSTSLSQRADEQDKEDKNNK
ncbi:hypothetical protein ABID22_003875 [Pontibacter aydingkolensis]|uniref:Uncharacterized protein n=1 Tax=Pontibacter aydingkolensis TaxID=1911536 RepID=A0ABS7CZA8_9BACT|nr:hypothetical protein [Pontibacter aydingkolensis]MBW7469159.1 hypothetical protein [Pontibacter aydingkolensis]